MNFLVLFSLIGASFALSVGNINVFTPRTAVPLAEVFPSVFKFYGPNAWANRLGQPEYAPLVAAPVVSPIAGRFALPVGHNAYIQSTPFNVGPYANIAGPFDQTTPFAAHAYAGIPAVSGLVTSPLVHKYFSRLFHPNSANIYAATWPFGINRLINGGFYANRCNGLPFAICNKDNTVTDVDAVFTERDLAGHIQGVGKAHETMTKNVASQETGFATSLGDLTNAGYVRGFPVRDAAHYFAAARALYGRHSNIYPAGTPVIDTIVA